MTLSAMKRYTRLNLLNEKNVHFYLVKVKKLF
jgi:hypothetical protein